MVIVPSLPASFSSQSGSAIEQVKGSAIPGNANGSSITNSSFHTDILGSRITGYVATGNSTVPINKKVGSLSVVITLKYQDQAGLNSYLQELQDPSSPFYHHYLTHREFVQRYSPPAEVYNSLNKYLASRGFDTKTYSDRVSVGVSGSASQFDSLFHTSIMNVKKGNSTFYAPVKPVSLGWQYHGAISNVAGLSDEHTAQISPLFTGPSVQKCFSARICRLHTSWTSFTRQGGTPQTRQLQPYSGRGHTTEVLSPPSFHRIFHITSATTFLPGSQNLYSTAFL